MANVKTLYYQCICTAANATLDNDFEHCLLQAVPLSDCAQVHKVGGLASDKGG